MTHPDPPYKGREKGPTPTFPTEGGRKDPPRPSLQREGESNLNNLRKYEK